MKIPRKGRAAFDARKLALLRRADTERDERDKATFGKPAPITLPHVSILDKPVEDEP